MIPSVLLRPRTTAAAYFLRRLLINSRDDIEDLATESYFLKRKFARS
jgi:hypothetical protein